MARPRWDLLHGRLIFRYSLGTDVGVLTFPLLLVTVALQGGGHNSEAGAGEAGTRRGMDLWLLGPEMVTQILRGGSCQ